ncbi:UPF0488 protein C8orf33 homolog isoform 3-T3 [Hipposideros larvatus]
MAALGHPARETPAAAGPGPARAPRSPRLLRPLPGAPSPPAVGSHPACLCSGHPACSDAASRAHPVGGESDAVLKKQKKKRSRNGASASNGGGKAAEKPAPEEAPRSAETQARAVPRGVGFRGGAAGSGTGLVRGAAGTGPQDAETQPKTEGASSGGNPNPAQRKNPPAPEEAADAFHVWGLQGSDGSRVAGGPAGSQDCTLSAGAACR